MGNDIDPVEFGKLINAVSKMEEQIKLLTSEVGEIRQTITGSKGVAAGLMIAAGGLGAGLTKFVDHVFK